MLRATPNLQVFRPARRGRDRRMLGAGARGQTSAPSALLLSRQNLPTLRGRSADVNLSARGAYVLSEPDGRATSTLLATGSEVALADRGARTTLRAGGQARGGRVDALLGPVRAADDGLPRAGARLRPAHRRSRRARGSAGTAGSASAASSSA